MVLIHAGQTHTRTHAHTHARTHAHTHTHTACTQARRGKNSPDIIASGATPYVAMLLFMERRPAHGTRAQRQPSVFHTLVLRHRNTHTHTLPHAHMQASQQTHTNRSWITQRHAWGRKYSTHADTLIKTHTHAYTHKQKLNYAQGTSTHHNYSKYTDTCSNTNMYTYTHTHTQLHNQTLHLVHTL